MSSSASKSGLVLERSRQFGLAPLSVYTVIRLDHVADGCEILVFEGLHVADNSVPRIVGRGSYLVIGFAASNESDDSDHGKLPKAHPTKYSA